MQNNAEIRAIIAKLGNIEHATVGTLPWVNRGIVYTITDLLAGLQYNIVGEHNRARHADYVCDTRADMEIKLRTASGNFNNNWEARPCILTIGDRHFFASTHNAAHPPDMRRWRVPAEIGHSGHFCVWVREAQTGGSDSYRRSMLAAIEEACRLVQAMQTEMEEENMSQDKFNEMMGKYLEGLASRPESSWSEIEGHWKRASELKVFDGINPQGFLTREQAAAVLGRAGLLLPVDKSCETGC